MKIRIFFLLTISLSLFSLSGQSLFEKDDVSISWEVREDRLVVVMSAPTTGWLAFGTGATKIMRDANLIQVWVDDDMGIAMGEDHFGTGSFSHKRDIDLGGAQNLQILSGRQTQEDTTVSFSLPLGSSDEYDTLLERGETYPLLLAYGKNDNTGRKHSWAYTGTITIP